MATIRTIRRAFQVPEPVEQIAANGLLDAARLQPPQARKTREVVVEEVRDVAPQKKAHPSVQRAGRVYAMSETDAIRRRLEARLDSAQKGVR